MTEEKCKCEINMELLAVDEKWDGIGKNGGKMQMRWREILGKKLMWRERRKKDIIGDIKPLREKKKKSTTNEKKSIIGNTKHLSENLVGWKKKR